MFAETMVCMAMAIYHEAKNQPLAGQVAVGQVIMNRVADDRWPSDVCSVIKQGPVRESWKTRQNPDLFDDERSYYPVRDRCQFSFYCDGKSDEMRDRQAKALAYAAAHGVLHKQVHDLVEGATFYHASWMEKYPSWSRSQEYVVQIEDHIFYK